MRLWCSAERRRSERGEAMKNERGESKNDEARKIA